MAAAANWRIKNKNGSNNKILQIFSKKVSAVGYADKLYNVGSNKKSEEYLNRFSNDSIALVRRNNHLQRIKPKN